MEEFKYLIFFTVLIFGVPLTGIVCGLVAPLRRLLFSVIFFLTLFAQDVNFYALPFYRGTSRGFSVSALDLAALALIVAVMVSPRMKFHFFPPGWWLYALYFIGSMISVFVSEIPLVSCFELWKVGIMWGVYVAVYNEVVNDQDFSFLDWVLPGIVGLCMVESIYQKYFGGIYQIRSFFPHQNTFSMYISAWGLILLGMALSAGFKRLRGWIFGFSYLMCTLMVFFTFSRGGIFAFLFGAVLTGTLSLFFGSRRKERILVLCAVALLGLLGGMKMLPRIIDRFENAPVESKEDRIFLAKSAVEYANTHPFGIGLNTYCYRMNYEDVSGVPLTELETTDFKYQIVETVYLLIAAESGWWVLAVYLSLLLYFYVLMLKNLRFYKNDEQKIGFFWGLFGALTAIYMQSMLEWVLKQPWNFYQLLILFGITAGCYKAYQYKKKSSGNEIAEKESEKTV